MLALIWSIFVWTFSKLKMEVDPYCDKNFNFLIPTIHIFLKNFLILYSAPQLLISSIGTNIKVLKMYKWKYPYDNCARRKILLEWVTQRAPLFFFMNSLGVYRLQQCSQKGDLDLRSYLRSWNANENVISHWYCRADRIFTSFC